MNGEIILLIVYILSISAQVAGAILLLVFSFSTKRKNVLLDFAQTGVLQEDEDNNKIWYNHKAFKNKFKVNYLSKYAFILIAIGYFLGIFGKIEDKHKVTATFFIFVITGLFVYAIYKYIEKKVENIEEITLDEIKSLGIAPDITFMTSDDALSIIEKVKEKMNINN